MAFTRMAASFFLALSLDPAHAGRKLGGRNVVQEAQQQLAIEADSTSTTIINIMVVWTRRYECHHSGEPTGCIPNSTTTAKVRAKIDRSIANANRAFANSQIGGRLNAVRIARHRGFGETNITEDMNQMNRCEIRNLCTHRDNSKAHITVAFTYGGGLTGVARQGGGDRRFRSAALGRGASDWTLAHEVGHIFGCREDRQSTTQLRGSQSVGCTSDQTWFGYRSPDSKWRDLMSLNCVPGRFDCSINRELTERCRLMPHYSDPNIRFNGIRTGSAQCNCAAQMRVALPLMTRSPTTR